MIAEAINGVIKKTREQLQIYLQLFICFSDYSAHARVVLAQVQERDTVYKKGRKKVEKSSCTCVRR